MPAALEAPRGLRRRCRTTDGGSARLGATVRVGCEPLARERATPNVGLRARRALEFVASDEARSRRGLKLLMASTTVVRQPVEVSNERDV